MTYASYIGKMNIMFKNTYITCMTIILIFINQYNKTKLNKIKILLEIIGFLFYFNMCMYIIQFDFI